MNKKGQIYILAALILSVVLFRLAATVNLASPNDIKDDFEKLSNNYESEGIALMNSVINNQGDVSDAFRRFTALFTAYSKTTNPRFGLIYALDYNDQLHIGNFLDQPIIIDCAGCVPEEVIGCYEKLDASIRFEGLSLGADLNQQLINECTLTIDHSVSEISVIIDGLNYNFNIVKDSPEVIIVSREYVGELSKVFAKGEFKKGEKREPLTFSTYCSSINDPERCRKICEWDGSCKLKSCSAYTYRNGCQKDDYCCWEPKEPDSFLGICRQSGACKEV
jgi:hypothetical protein